jgi:hypothetical protein
MVEIYLPTQLSSLAAGRKKIEVEASTLSEVFLKIDEIAPMLRSQIFDARGVSRRFVAIFVDEHQISSVCDGACSVRDTSQIRIVVSVAGG